MDRKKEKRISKAEKTLQHETGPPLSQYWGARHGAVVRALASHQCGPGSSPRVDAICGLSLLLVLSLAPRRFSAGTPVFSSPQKPTFPNSNSTRNQVDKEPLCGCATSKSLFIYYYSFIIYLLFIITITVLNTKIRATYLQMLPRPLLHLQWLL